MDVALYAIDDDAERGVHDVEVGIDAKCGSKKDFALPRVSIEEIAVVEIAVRAGKGDRFRRLVDRKIVCLGKHRGWPPSRPGFDGRASFLIALPVRMTACLARVNLRNRQPP